MENTHYDLKIDFMGGAALFVPFDTNWRKSICSFQKQMEQFYLFRSILGGAVLLVSVHIQWRNSIYSIDKLLKLF